MEQAAGSDKMKALRTAEMASAVFLLEQCQPAGEDRKIAVEAGGDGSACPASRRTEVDSWGACKSQACGRAHGRDQH